MIDLYIDGHPYMYEVQAVCMLFLSGEKIRAEREIPASLPERYIYTGMSECEGVRTLTVSARLFSRERLERRDIPPECGDIKRESERAFGRMLYEILSGQTGCAPPWGILTGVRPVRLMSSGIARGMEREALLGEFCGELFVSREKAELAYHTALTQRAMLAENRPEYFSLYVSIPFCPTRCKYCSFVSHSVESARALIEPYVALLCEELREIGRIARESALVLRSVYFGGGTPTTLSAAQLARLFSAIEKSFPMGAVREYTVEAGRPDTITREALAAMSRAGVGRISINPQTMSDKVLKAMGRTHTAEDVARAFAAAREFNFTVNADLIAGLEGDSPAGFAQSLSAVLALGAKNITVHALSLKRSAELITQKTAVLQETGAAEMVSAAAKTLGAAGYLPYYLYRQKNTVCNLENTGWCLPGEQSEYNTMIMDESRTILAAGAGGASKLVRGDDIKRIFNYKYPYEYISRFEELLEKKRRISGFFAASRAE